VLGKELLLGFYALHGQILQLCTCVDSAEVDLQLADGGISSLSRPCRGLARKVCGHVEDGRLLPMIAQSCFIATADDSIAAAEKNLGPACHLSVGSCFLTYPFASAI